MRVTKWCQVHVQDNKGPRPDTSNDGPRPKLIFGKTRRCLQSGKWGKWNPLVAQDIKPGCDAKIGHSVCTLEMGKSGASITYLPRMLPEERRKAVADSCRNCTNYRQYMAGPMHEPRVHVLFSNNTQNGYKYHSVSMQPLPLSDEPVIESLANDLASYHELPNNEWNIGCNAVAYLDGNHSIGFHADDTQDEENVFTFVPEAPDETRPVVFRTKRAGRKEKGAKAGDEEYHLFIRPGDAYGMNRLCNVHYEHSVPKAKSVKGLRLALVFRQGNTRKIEQDSGVPVEGLSSLHLPGRFFGHPHHRKIGEICIVEGGGLYSRQDLLQSGAHVLDRRGVDGNKDCGVYAIVVSRQDEKKGEGDGLKWLTYTSTIAQGAKAMLTSYWTGKPIRVFRTTNLKSVFSPPARAGGSTSYRYDGLYVAKGIVNNKGSVVKPGHLQAKNVEHTFYLERLPSRGEAMAHAQEQSEFYKNGLSASRLWEEIQSMSDDLQPKQTERTTKEKKTKHTKRIPSTMRKPRVYVSKPVRRQVAVEEVGLPVPKKDSGGGAAGWVVENNVVTLIEDSGICEGRLVANKMESEDAMILSILNTGVDKLLLLKLLDCGDSKLAHYFQSRRSFRLYRSSKLKSPFAPNPSEEGSIRDDGFYSVTEVRDEDGNFVDESDFNPLEDKLYWFIVERLDHASPDGFGRQNFLSAERLWESIRRDTTSSTGSSKHVIKAYEDRNESDRDFIFDSIPRFSKRRRTTRFE